MGTSSARGLVSWWTPLALSVPLACVVRGLVLASLSPWVFAASSLALIVVIGFATRSAPAALARLPACAAALVLGWAPAFAAACVDLALLDGPRADLAVITRERLGLVGTGSVILGLVLAAVAARWSLRRASTVLAVVACVASGLLSGVVALRGTDASRAGPTMAFRPLQPGMEVAFGGRTVRYVDVPACTPPVDDGGCRLEGLGAPIQLRGCPRLEVHADDRLKVTVIEWNSPSGLPRADVGWPLVAYREDGTRVDVSASYARPLLTPPHLRLLAAVGLFVAIALLLVAAYRPRERAWLSPVALVASALAAGPLAWALAAF